jgi:CIC family chloride channel protein
MALGGAIVGAIGIFLPEVWGNGFEATNRILHGNPTLLFLAALFTAKIAATAATIGSGGVGGVFTPSLLVGATLGGAVARIFQAAVPGLEAPVGGYALLGMGALLAGVTRAPLLAVIMIFEMTQNTQVLLPMMVISVAAILSASVFEEESLYVQSLRSAGIVWEKTPEATAMSSLKVSDIVRTDVRLIPHTAPFSQVVRTFLETRSLYLYIGDEQGRLLGVIDLHDIKSRFADPNLSDLVIAEDLVTEIPFVTPQEPLTSVNEKLWFRDLGQLPVVDSAESRRFAGIVTRRDLLGAFDHEVLQRSPAPRARPDVRRRRRGVRSGLLRASGEASAGRAPAAVRARRTNDRRGGTAQSLWRLGAGGAPPFTRRAGAEVRSPARGIDSNRATC